MPRGRPRKFPSIADLQAMIRDRKRHLTRLVQERRKLQGRLDQVESQIASLNGRGAGGRGAGGGARGSGRRRAGEALPDVIEQVLKKAGKPMGVGEIAQAAQRAGYRSSSANFRGIVNQTLIKDKRFVSPSRGMYQLK